MCTAATYQTKDHYFGRNLDLEFSYDEAVTVTPRNFPFCFRNGKSLACHYAMIGVAYVVDNFPLYYDATNEKGLSMAGLNFPGEADYKQPLPGRDNIAPFEFIPWVLGQCADLGQARALLERLNLVGLPFNDQLPLTPLHWIIADREGALTVECVRDGLHVYDNPVGILTNSPPFDFQMWNLSNYMSLSRDSAPVNRFCPQLDLKPYSRGMGAIGLPGDLSSASRFVRAAFTRMNSVSGDSEAESVNQFFHILGSVMQQRGCCLMEDGKYEFTIYSSCCNTDRGIYYYVTYDNSQLSAVDLHREDLEGATLAVYPLQTSQQVQFLN
jgi:choloylglycine hydrolase